MATEKLVKALEMTLTPNNSGIREAEEYLAEASKHKGFIKELMIIINNDSISIPVRTASVCFLKTQIDKNYDSLSGISDVDKNFLKDNILDCICLNIEINTIRETFKEILIKAIDADYPKDWPNLVEIALDKMKAASKTNDLYASLVVIECLIDAYQLAIGSKRTPLEVILKNIFPYMENLAGNQLKNWTKDSTRILTVIMTCFYKSIYLEISPYFKNSELKTWMYLLKTLIDREIDPSLVKKTEDWKEICERAEHESWKLKLVCCQTISKLNYHIKKMKDRRQIVQEIKQAYLANYSRGLLESCFNLLKGVRSHYIPPKIVSHCINAIGNAIENDSLFELLQPSFEMILFDHVFPLLALNGKDQEYWEDDPAQFLYSEEQAIDDHNVVKNSGKAIINLILKYKNSSKGVPMALVMMEYLAFVFRDKKDMRSGKELTPMMKEYLYRALEMGAETLLNHRKVVDGIEEMLEFVIVPDLESEFDVLRSRACSVIAKLGGVQLENKKNYLKICTGICKNLMHKHTCIRVKATKALNCILMHEKFRELLRPEIPHILDSVVKTMNRIESDTLIEALEGITTEFSDSMGKYAVELIKRLSLSFKDYIKSYEDEQKNMDDEGASQGEELTESKKAAEACLDAITNILRAKLSEDIYKDVTPTILDLLNISLLAGDKYCSEKCFSFLNILLYKSNKLSDEMLFYYPILVYFITGKPTKEPVLDTKKLPKIFQDILKSSRVFGNQIDSFESMVGCFLNYISKGKSQFLKCTDIYGIKFIDLLFEMIKKIGNYGIKTNNYGDLCLGIRLLIGLIENLRGKIDHLVEKILDISCDLMKEDKTDNLKSVLIQLICMMFWYDPKLAIKLLDKKNYTKGVLEVWFKNVKIFSSDFEKERELYGIAGLISLSSKHYPDFLHPEAVGIEILKVSTDIVNIRNNHFNQNDDQIEFVDVDFSADDDSDDDPIYEDDEPFEDYNEVFNFYDSPLEESCPIMLIKDVLKDKEKNDPSFFKLLVKDFSTGDKEKLFGNFDEAKHQFNERMKDIKGY